jgi:hypothetical protein
MVTAFVMMLAIAAVAGWPDASQGQTAEKPPTFTYWHNWTDNDGVSHLSQCEMSNFVRNFVLQSSEPVDPAWQDRQKAGQAQVLILVLPVGWKGHWHQNPKVQWIVPLKGTWFVEAMDGKKVSFGPGEVCLGEDFNTKPDASGHIGHLSGNASEDPVTLMLIQLDEPPTINEPCHFK